MKPVSVIIVNYNAGALLSECVGSVLASSIPVEVIVSDNQSTDGSIFELRSRFASESRIKIIENPANLGFARANNIALQESHGDYILFLNPDCLIRQDTIPDMLTALRHHPKAGMAGCLIRNPDGSEQPGCRRSIPTPWRTFIRLTRLSNFAKYHPRFESYLQTGLPIPNSPQEVEAISGAFMFVRRDAIDRIGVMDEGYFMHCEDLDWCMRFRQARLGILFVPSVEIIHVGGVCSASRPISVEYYKHIGMVRFYRKFFRDRYSPLLMLLVIVAIGARFLFRLPAYFIPGLNPKIRRARESSVPTLQPAENNMAPPAFPHLGPSRKIMVTGATSLIGDYLLPKLLGMGFEVHALSRNPPDTRNIPGLSWHKNNIATDVSLSSHGADTLIHLAPLPTLPPLLEKITDKTIRRVIGFGSTSLFTKFQSGYEKERLAAHALKDAEDRLAEICSKQDIHWTVFRPTLVYHLGRDKNVTTIANFILRFGFFPMVGDGNGLRQPVHAEDLSQACINALDNPQSYGQSYNLSGGETLTYREMVRRICKAIGRQSWIVNMPLPVFRIFIRGLSFLPRYRHLTPEMANRINRNLCFDHLSARRDLNFAPRQFLAS